MHGCRVFCDTGGARWTRGPVQAEELRRINSYRVPRDKLVAIVNCSRLLLKMLSLDTESPASADDYLPSLIHTLILAAPENMHANLEFIQRFRQPAKLSGVIAYIFTNVYSAVTFIERAEASQLNITEEELERCVLACATRCTVAGDEPSRFAARTSGRLLR